MSGSRHLRDMRIRIILIVIAIPAVLFRPGVHFQCPGREWDVAVRITRTTYLLLAAVSFAFAAPVLWAAWTWDFAAVAGVGLTVAVGYALFSLMILTMLGPNQGLWLNLVITASIALIGVGGFYSAPTGSRGTGARRRCGCEPSFSSLRGS